MRCLKITAESQNLASKFFKSKEYFPIEINFGDKEKIRITKRPRKTTTEIVDVYANTIHIGMFVGIEKVGSELRFGPAGINKSHSYRGILDFTFIKLLEYFGLDELKSISIDVPEDTEFKQFLISLGFLTKINRMILELDEKKTAEMFKLLTVKPVAIKSQVGQIETIIRSNDTTANDDKVFAMVDTIVEKIKNMDPLGKEFWDNRKIAQINYYLSTAVLFPDKLEQDEFLDGTIKTIIGSLDTFNREPYMEELLIALEGGKPFSMDYIQSIIVHLRELVPNAIKELNKDEMRKWVQEMLPTWIINDKIEVETRNKIISDAQLVPTDFGSSIKENMKSIITDIMNHYNGTKIFYGVNNRL
ncbi:hypothetical protein [Candidatus Lokiarchaeum ossiferum]|uniref:hypothetical protein n=1 Tax=Candidatus Lokiarchaeum ossiferum TaxID=2951803 RepID=UPI00352C071C